MIVQLGMGVVPTFIYAGCALYINITISSVWLFEVRNLQGKHILSNTYVI